MALVAGPAEADVIYSAEQIRVPPELARVLKDYTKEVIRRQPNDLIAFSARYFADMADLLPREELTAKPPNLVQIRALFSALASMDTLQREAEAVGIEAPILEQVLRMADFGSTSAMDPVDVCVLLVTTSTASPRELVAAMAEVFGETGSLEASLCRDLFAVLAKHDPRWDTAFFEQLDESLANTEWVAHNTLIELPCIKARVAGLS